MTRERFLGGVALALAIIVLPGLGPAQDRPERVITITVAGETAYEFIGKDVILLGRDETNHIRLQSQYVSRSHAKITCFQPTGCLLTDLRSTNGTTLNGETVAYGRNAELEDGDAIGVADINLMFRTQAGSSD